jgi:hypothetical protein
MIFQNPSRFAVKAAILTFTFALGVLPLGAQEKKSKAAPAKKPNPAMTPVTDVEGLPRVLLIGDSISIGYTVPVQEKLKGKANVHRPLTNCGPTTNGLANLTQWLATGGADKKWDVIHLNWGLHDLKYVGADGKTIQDVKAAGSKQQVSPDQYRENLQKLVDQLVATGAKLIWRNTTPVPEGTVGRIPGDDKIYNEIAAEVMKKAGIPVHDLYSYALAHQKELQLEANVHFSPQGSDALGEEVARVILETLKP